MVGHDPARIELQHLAQARRHLLWPAGEDRRRQVGVEEVAGEEVAREEQVVLLAVEPAVAVRVAGQMDHPQPAPEGQRVAFSDRLVDQRRAVAERPAARGLQPSAPAGGPFIGILTVDVELLGGVAVHPRPGPRLEGREVARVVEMAMGQDDGLDGVRLQSQPAEQTAESARALPPSPCRGDRPGPPPRGDGRRSSLPGWGGCRTERCG